ncbi:hypothetical protein CGLO_00169 [Colletotrichum gloeosporioides Cg-14]|uniref:Uncharacterized protein n=1 Tax=Colletotrichum gloeosporioides (strain Cg-14) TaxID=1237896 RepID=T0MEG5_COLGC|nr:hypothetical protein CGLO_00169 [Colletotrichum gloeosporioides Cg-14]
MSTTKTYSYNHNPPGAQASLAPPAYSEIDPAHIRRLSINSVSSDSELLDASEQEEPNAALNIEPGTGWIPELHATNGNLSSPLQKPVVIPRIDFGGPLKVPLPFMRAYSPDLRAHDIHEEDFVGFIDNLTVAQGPPAPLAALNAAGTIVGYVPNHWAQLAGGITNLTVGVGSAATRIIRSKVFLEKVNKEYFAPRGLKASVYLQPRDVNWEMDITARRMSALQPYIAPLTFDVPPPTKDRNIIDRLTEKQIQRRVKKKEKKKGKRATKMRRKQSRQERRQSERNGTTDLIDSDSSSSSSSSSFSSSSDSDMEHLNRKAEIVCSKADEKLEGASHKEAKDIQKKRDEKLRKIEQRMEKAEESERKKREKTAKKREKRAKKRGKHHAKDHKKANKMEFIVIESLKSDSSNCE